MSHNITIASGSSVRLPTAGKYCDRDIVITAEVEHYEGSYDVTPMVTQQVLPTKEKFMTDDVTVMAIPVFDVSNTSGGTTFYIATMNEDPQGGIAILGKSKLGSMIL